MKCAWAACVISFCLMSTSLCSSIIIALSAGSAMACLAASCTISLWCISSVITFWGAGKGSDGGSACMCNNGINALFCVHRS